MANPFSRLDQSALNASLMGAGFSVLANNQPRPISQGPNTFGSALGHGGLAGMQMYQALTAPPKDRRIVKGADGYNYYADTGDRVLPKVTKPPTKDKWKYQTGHLPDGSTAQFRVGDSGVEMYNPTTMQWGKAPGGVSWAKPSGSEIVTLYRDGQEIQVEVPPGGSVKDGIVVGQRPRQTAAQPTERERARERYLALLGNDSRTPAEDRELKALTDERHHELSTEAERLQGRLLELAGLEQPLTGAQQREAAILTQRLNSMARLPEALPYGKPSAEAVSKLSETISRSDSAIKLIDLVLNASDSMLGFVGLVRGFAQKITGATEDVARHFPGAGALIDSTAEWARDWVKLRGELAGDPEGAAALSDELFNPDIVGKADIYENAIGMLYARTLFGDEGRTPIETIRRAISNVELTGFRSAETTRDRLRVIKSVMADRQNAAVERLMAIQSRDRLGGTGAPEAVYRFVTDEDGKTSMQLVLPAGAK
jgi:hypothetical protein